MITLYPAIDLQDGLAVRLVQGDFAASTTFNEDPVAQAQLFADDGATALHVVDLDGAREGVPAQAPLVAEIANRFPGDVQLGGGLRTKAAIETAVATGVHRIVLGTVALQDRELLEWAVRRLEDRLAVAIDRVAVGRRGRDRQFEDESAALADGAFDPYLAAVLFDNFSSDGQP